MKKVLLLLFGFFIAAQSFAQDPDLFRTWYLYEIQGSDLDPLFVVVDIDPPIQPWITILETLEFNGEGACNTFIGTYSYDSQYDEFTSNDLTETGNDCNIPVHNSFENTYFGFMHQIMPVISTDSNGLTLRIDTPIFGYAIFKDYPLSINDNAFENNITTYPNPVSNQLFISAENLQVEKISIYSMNGKEVLSTKTKEKSIDVSNLSEGLYFIEVISPEGRNVQKFIKN